LLPSLIFLENLDKDSEPIVDFDDNHHCLSLRRSHCGRLLDPNAAPALDALILRLERRLDSTHIIDVALASPT
jgi:hypothetical protein